MPHDFAVDQLVLVPDDIDLGRSPLAGAIEAETYVLGAFNPGLTRLANGNLLMMVRVAEALRTPVDGDHIRSIRWSEEGYRLDRWPLDEVDASDPRIFLIRGSQWPTLALTSLSWLLPVEMSPDGLSIVDIHYDRAIAPDRSSQCYGIEDARISRVGERYLMTVCSVAPDRHATMLYSSSDAMDWTNEGLVLDHQNKDMLILEGLVGGRYWAQTRPLGQVYFAYPPDSDWLAGPAINLASSPDGLHWRPEAGAGLRPAIGSFRSARIGGGTPPVLTDKGWLSLWHGAEANSAVGTYRTYWAMMDEDDPATCLYRSDPDPLLSPAPHLTEPLAEQLYLKDIVFTTGIVDAGDYFIVASGEADLACRMTHIPKSVFGL